MKTALSVALVIPLVSTSYFDGKGSTAESPKRATKYLKFLKSSSQLLGSGSTTSARYIQSPTSHSHFQSTHGHVYQPHQHSHGPTHHFQYGHHGQYGDNRAIPHGNNRMGMMTSASERAPSRIIIVRQPSSSSGGSSKKNHHSAQTYSTVQYLPQASSAGPTVAYPSYGVYPSYGYAPQTLSPYGYQMPAQLQMAASAYGPQVAAPTGFSPSAHSHSPLVASMIAAAQRVTQGQTAHAYGGQYASAASYMSPQYSLHAGGPAYGYGAVPTPMYQPGYGYLG